VQPIVALALGLKAAGHELRLAVPPNFESFVRDRNLDYFRIEDNAERLAKSEPGFDMAGADNPVAFVRHFVRLHAPLMERAMANCLQACHGSDLILATTPTFFLAQAVAEKLHLPMCGAYLQPIALSRHQPNFLYPELPAWLPGMGIYNLVTHALSGEFLWQYTRPALNRARWKVLGLPSLPFLGPPIRYFTSEPMLHGYSSAVVPKPSDWGQDNRVTGYWFLDDGDNFKPSRELTDFLASGSPPVYVGFGSLPNRNPAEAAQMVMGALRQLGLRGILLRGWGGLAPTTLGDDMLVLDSAPHSWLFPQMAAVVHHGGAGTTAAAIRAGVPAVVVPFTSDQPFWGRRVHELGVGPKPVPHDRLTTQRLVAALRLAVGDPGIRARADALGRRVRSEDGVGCAVDFLGRRFAMNTPGLTDARKCMGRRGHSLPWASSRSK